MLPAARSQTADGSAFTNCRWKCLHMPLTAIVSTSTRPGFPSPSNVPCSGGRRLTQHDPFGAFLRVDGMRFDGMQFKCAGTRSRNKQRRCPTCGGSTAYAASGKLMVESAITQGGRVELGRALMLLFGLFDALPYKRKYKIREGAACWSKHAPPSHGGGGYRASARNGQRVSGSGR